MSESIRGTKVTSRGTVLLEEFEKSLPNFDSLDTRQRMEFSRTIELMCNHYGISRGLLGEKPLSQSNLIMYRLRQLYREYIEEDKLVASAIFFVMAHIESYYLDDPDGKLVHDLTSLHVDHPITLDSLNQVLNSAEAEPHGRLRHPARLVTMVISRATSLLAALEDLVGIARTLLNRCFLQKLLDSKLLRRNG